MVLAGIGGYGNIYLEVLLDWHLKGRLKLTGLVDPVTATCQHLPNIAELGIPIYSSLTDFYRHQFADLLIVSTPVQYHAALTCEALANNTHVLCEKPLVSSLGEINQIDEAAARSSAQIAVGYQWSFTRNLQRCKSDILAGRFGRPLRAKSLVIIPRTVEYFSRNSWAGRIHTSNGLPVLDSPVNNAHAHYLHNLFYLTGPSRETSATPLSVQAELYRANAIENYDTGALRCQTAEGVEVLFYSTHAFERTIGPRFEIEFEHGVLTGETDRRCRLQATLSGGEVIDYGELCEHPDEDYWEKIWQLNEARLSGEPVVCGLPASRAHALCTLGAQQSPAGIANIDPAHIHSIATDESTQLSIQNLDGIFENCYRSNCLPTELGGQSVLTTPGRTIDLQADMQDSIHR